MGTLGARVVTGRPLRFSSNNGKRAESRRLAIMGWREVDRLHLPATAQLEAPCQLPKLAIVDRGELGRLCVDRSGGNRAKRSTMTY